MRLFVKIPIALALGSTMLAGTVSAVSAQSYRAAPGYYVGAAPYNLRSPYAYDAYAYTGPIRGQFGSYELGFRGCASDGNYSRADHNAC